MTNFKTFIVEIYPPDDVIRKEIDSRIQKGTPKNISIAQGWMKYKENKKKNIDKINKENNPYYRAKQGIN